MDVCKDPYYREQRYLQDGWAGLAQHDDMCESSEADKDTRDRIRRSDTEKRRRQEDAELAWNSLSEPEEFVPKESFGETLVEGAMNFPVDLLAHTASAPLTSWIVDLGPINKLSLAKGLGVTIPAEMTGLPAYLRGIEQKGWNTLGLHPEQADDLIYDAYGKFKDWLRGDK